MSDREYLKDVVFVVIASDFEKFSLWEEWHEKIKWVCAPLGHSAEIGTLDNRPVAISLLVDELEGRKVLFVEEISQVRDSVMLDKWLDKNCAPRWNRKKARTDAQNFQHVIHCLEKLNKEKVTS